MRFLIAPDKFKGSLTAAEVAQAIAAGVRRVLAEAVCDLAPIADGGEGTVELLHAALGGSWIEVPVRGPRGNEVGARYSLLADGTALMEMSQASGFQLVPPGERDVWRSSTFGTGEMLREAARRGATRILIGIGGSATNDAGLGMAAALGFCFEDAAGEPVEPWPLNFEKMARVRRGAALALPPIEVLSDVTNPLLGPRGSTRVYGPQKGLRAEEVESLERGMAHFAAVVVESLGSDFRAVPGSGAAGGLGFGLLSFGAAKLRPGFAAIAELTGLDARIAAADVVITGEGGMDAQTRAGKAPWSLAQRARAAGKVVIGIPGSVADAELFAPAFDRLFPLVNGETSLARALAEPALWLSERAAEAARVCASDGRFRNR